jgi:hypothetical protein
MTRQQREEFWRRFHAEIQRFREGEAHCDLAINPLEVRFLIPVVFDPASGTFLLHADHGPVEESQIADFFARTAGELLNRL